MGKFNFDDLLGKPGDTDAAPPPAPAPADEDSAAPAVAHSDADRDDLFVRKSAEETPRPPDMTSGGLGQEVDGALAAQTTDAMVVKPHDGVKPVFETGIELRDESGDDLGERLLSRGVVNAEQLSSAQRVIKQTPGKRLVQVLAEMGIDDVAIQREVAAIARLPFESIDAGDPESVDQRAINKLGIDFCRDSLVLPLRREGARYVIGTSNPDDVFLLDDIKRRLSVPSVKHVLLAPSQITAFLEANREEEADEYDVDELLADVDEDDVELVKDDIADADIEDADSSPVVRYVNHIIQTAMKEGASDIHIEPDEKRLKVRFRIDGVLFEMMNPPRRMHSALTSRIKIMANLDIAERRLPQDGRIRANVLGRKIDLRVSTIPTAHGEKTVMRLLDNRSISVELDELGFGEDTLMIWKNQIAQPHGIILVTGPTGSGKTTTLYSSIRQMDLRKLNVSTVEDPIEYNLSGITQIQTHERIGMTFAKALKALLRQDPDVVMLGEIRDMETATIAIQAAMTGHLVLSTLHTNDAPSSITRLINIGIEPFLVGAAVNAVLAQRLVRRICGHCAKDIDASEEIMEYLSIHGITTAKLTQGQGCFRCRETGYSGRSGLYEMLVLDDHLRDAVARNPNVTEFRRVCKERGMTSLREDGFQKVGAGVTTVEEILRVTEATI